MNSSMYFPTSCVGKKQDGWKIVYQDALGAGGQHATFAVCCQYLSSSTGYSENTCGQYVARMNRQPLTEDDKEELEHESDLQRLAAKHGIAIPIVDEFDMIYVNPHNPDATPQEKHVMILPRLAATFDIYYEMLINQLSDTSESDILYRIALKAIDLLKRLADIRIIHGDPHLENFMVDSAGRMYIIDFERAVKASAQRTRPYVDLVKFLLSLHDEWPNLYTAPIGDRSLIQQLLTDYSPVLSQYDPFQMVTDALYMLNLTSKDTPIHTFYRDIINIICNAITGESNTKLKYQLGQKRPSATIENPIDIVDSIEEQLRKSHPFAPEGYIDAIIEEIDARTDIC